jgi:hypothetical protein
MKAALITTPFAGCKLRILMNFPGSRTGNRLKHDADSMNRHHALRYCLSIAFAENRFPLFGTML